ncbi:MAG: AI-2E family transporter [Ignavibacteria bacterium]|nr:AI-2E family transporter [Ignavibacteria bacterium]
MNSNYSTIPAYIRYSIFFTGICALGFLLYIGQDIIIPICFALLFAILLDPLVTFFQKIKIPRTLAITFAIIFAFLLITVTIYFISNQLSLFNGSLPKFREKFNIVSEQIKSWISSEFNISLQTINSQTDKWSKSILIKAAQ